MKQQTTHTTKTMLTITMGFLVVYLIGQWNWAMITALIVGFIGMFSTYLSQKVEWLWMQLTKILSYIVPNILLSAVFYLLLFPVAVLARIFGKKDALMLKGGAASTYIIRNKNYGKEDFTHPW
jgi:Zn-dependent protease with chaperone function